MQRKIPLVTDQIYHVFNKSIRSEIIFPKTRDYQRMVDTLTFYQFAEPPLSLSLFLNYLNNSRYPLRQHLDD